MTPAADILKQYPLSIDVRSVREALADVRRELELYRDILEKFRTENNCELSEFEEKIRRHEIVEHPSWETALEWGVAQDEFDKLKVIRRALEWILNFLN